MLHHPSAHINILHSQPIFHNVHKRHMQDPISVTRLELLHPSQRENFKSFIEDCEALCTMPVRIVQGLRTFAEQDAIYAQGRTAPGPIATRAKGGQSFHCFGLAVDVVPLCDGQPQWEYDYSTFAPIAEKYGLTWGHAWHDNDHFENNLGHGPSGWAYFLELHNSGKVDGDGYVILDAVA